MQTPFSRFVYTDFKTAGISKGWQIPCNCASGSPEHGGHPGYHQRTEKSGCGSFLCGGQHLDHGIPSRLKRLRIFYARFVSLGRRWRAWPMWVISRGKPSTGALYRPVSQILLYCLRTWYARKAARMDDGRARTGKVSRNPGHSDHVDHASRLSSPLDVFHLWPFGRQWRSPPAYSEHIHQLSGLFLHSHRQTAEKVKKARIWYGTSAKVWYNRTVNKPLRKFHIF